MGACPPIGCATRCNLLAQAARSTELQWIRTQFGFATIFRGLQGMPHHVLHDLLPNAHWIMAGHRDKAVDWAISGFGISNRAPVEGAQLGQQCSISDWSSKSSTSCP